MNKATNHWAVYAGTTQICEAIQRIAFSFGYRWNWDFDKNNVRSTPVHLIFNPDNKTITYTDLKNTVWLNNNVNIVVYSFDKVINFLKVPPVIEVPQVLKISNDTIEKNGDVIFNRFGQAPLKVSSDIFDKIVKDRSEFLGIKKPTNNKKIALPLVIFTYINCGEETVRRVYVTSYTVNTISGYDHDDNNKFKQFLSRKVIGSVIFLAFREVDIPHP